LTLALQDASGRGKMKIACRGKNSGTPFGGLEEENGVREQVGKVRL